MGLCLFLFIDDHFLGLHHVVRAGVEHPQRQLVLSVPGQAVGVEDVVLALDVVVGHFGRLDHPAVDGTFDAGRIGLVGEVDARNLSHDHHAVARETERQRIVELTLEHAALDGPDALERFFVGHGLRFLQPDGVLPVGDRTAVAQDELGQQLKIEVVDAPERNGGVGEVDILALLDGGFPLVGNRLVALHDAQNARRRSGVAVRILPAACGDVHRAEEIALAVEQADDHIGRVDDGVDVESVENAFGAPFFKSVAFFGL